MTELSSQFKIERKACILLLMDGCNIMDLKEESLLLHFLPWNETLPPPPLSLPNFSNTNLHEINYHFSIFKL